MNSFDEYLNKIDNPDHREQLRTVLQWVQATFPQLTGKIAWNQPMFTDHGTFIIGFSVAQKHFAVAPEGEGIEHFAVEIQQAGYDRGKKFMRIPWDTKVNYDLLGQMIQFNLTDKATCQTFWRK